MKYSYSPCSRSNVATSQLPASQTLIRGVLPSKLSLMSGSAPIVNEMYNNYNNTTMSTKHMQIQFYKYTLPTTADIGTEQTSQM